MSSYVKRVRGDGKLGYTGPIRSDRQAAKECAAWVEAGWSAEVIESTREVRAEVRVWQKQARERLVIA
jgi:hypothetical protein